MSLIELDCAPDSPAAQTLKKLSILKLSDTSFVLTKIPDEDSDGFTLMSEAFESERAVKFFVEHFVLNPPGESSSEETYFDGYVDFFNQWARIAEWLATNTNEQLGYWMCKSLAEDFLRDRPWKKPDCKGEE
jgi:hypothetical protein